MGITAETLRQALQRRDLTIEELIGAASRLLAEVAPHQTRYKVSDRPDVRTIRYYVTQHLLPPAVSYEGGRARYSGDHLLRLLVIKKMQAEHQTLQQIARALQASSDEQLIEALTRTPPTRPTARADSAPPATSAGPTEEPGRVVRVSRLVLLPEVTLDLPEGCLEDQARRTALADALEALAAQLRQGVQPLKQGA